LDGLTFFPPLVLFATYEVQLKKNSNLIKRTVNIFGDDNWFPKYRIFVTLGDPPGVTLKIFSQYLKRDAQETMLVLFASI